MKKLLILGLALVLASPVFAQNITKSLQGSQDPRGPVGQDTSNSMYFPGHINAFGQNTTATSLAQAPCNAGGTLLAGSTDVTGQLTTAGTSCTLNFGSPFNQAPSCFAQPVTAEVSFSSAPAVSTNTTVVSFTNVVSGQSYMYLCIGNK